MAVIVLGQGVRRLLNKPSRVFLCCLAFAALSLLFDGVLWRLWGLHRDHEKITTELISLQSGMGRLNLQLKQAKDPSYIERQARDRLDLASENDLVFVFPDEAP